VDIEYVCICGVSREDWVIRLAINVRQTASSCNAADALYFLFFLLYQ
jgi:hypothetical protein